jgi:UDP-2,3-diacylglucosamine hydrolase
MSLEIKHDAIFIADAHHSVDRPVLDAFLNAIENKRIKPSQIFWMGDIFDLLVGGIKQTIANNQNIIARINALKIEQYYFEGNHDFNLKEIFPKITVFSRKTHPVIARLGEKKVALSHGDIQTPFLYNFYIKTITNKAVLKILSVLNVNGWITDKIDAYNNGKNLCKKLKNFDEIIDIRLDKYKKIGADIVVEGHFHQNVSKVLNPSALFYINLPAFVCSQSFFIVKSDNERFFVEQELRSSNG